MNTPLDTALSDQALATARDLAANGTPTVAILPATGVCDWCGCDVTRSDHDPRFCAGCPRDAAMVMSVFSASDGERKDVLLCPGHKDDAMRFITAIIAAGGFSAG